MFDKVKVKIEPLVRKSIWRLRVRSRPGARFSKVPKLYGPFSGVTIPFVSQERKVLESSHFTVIFLFVTLKTFKRSAFQNKRLAISLMAFPARNVFGNFEKRAPHLGLKLSPSNRSCILNKESTRFL